MGAIHFSFFILISVAVCLVGISCIPDQIVDENLKQLAVANNKLGLNIFQKLASESSENIFISPLSLSAASGMLYRATKGETAKELREVLGYETAHLSEDLVHTTFQHYLTQVLPSQDTNAYVFSSSNAALLGTNIDIYPSYKTEIQDYYQAMVKEIGIAAKNGEVLQEINEWVKNKTNGKINKILDRLDISTVFALLNAVYFKGTWENKFENSITIPHKFYNKGSEVKEVPMMRLEGKFPYMKNSEFKVEAVELPYKGENISMIVLLPHERDGLESLEKTLSVERLKNIQLELKKSLIFLTLPKFKMQYSKDLSRDFEALGAKSIFSMKSDFSGMTESEYMYVSKILHKAVIEVNEEGSEAAAIPAITSVRRSQIFYPPALMNVDHPFLFVIVDKRNDMILFIGHVTDL